MSFDYDKLRGKEEEPNWWTSYSDLWSMLSIVFLMLYVVSSLRTGTEGIQQQIENQALAQKNLELQEQLRVYGTLRDETLQEQSPEEQEAYKKLMAKLDLLKEEAKNEKDELRRKAKENEEKEFALNQYQQIVRNIIDTNVLAKTSIQNRDKVIHKKQKTIAQKQAEIKNLNEEVKKREATISQNENKISDINSQLNKQIQRLEEAKKNAKISAIAMERTVARLKEDSSKRIAAIQTESATIRRELNRELESTRQNYAAQLESLREENQAKLAQERKDFEAKLTKQKLSAAAKAQKLEAFKQQAEVRAQQLEGELSGLVSKVKETEGQLQSTLSEKERLAAEARALAEQKRSLAGEVEKTKSELAGAKSELEGTKAQKDAISRSLAQAQEDKQVLGGELKKAQELLTAKKDLIAQIKKNFAQNGIKAAVDEKTGDVTIDFGDEYFDTGSANLKPGMVNTLKKMIPTYSKSLFENPKTAEKISNIEIIGFASSTYKGRYVNPSSLKPENQAAINYNLKLSFNRANSIFKQIFDPKKMQYSEQKRLLPMVKVVGRGFLPEGTSPKELPESMPESEFCKKFNCKKAQRVIVKFNLKD